MTLKPKTRDTANLGLPLVDSDVSHLSLAHTVKCFYISTRFVDDTDFTIIKFWDAGVECVVRLFPNSPPSMAVQEHDEENQDQRSPSCTH
mmetsp:Transcript_13716/g.26593  ORF Transcript_13716/g.26593 Transcript_13716/m.26593 type:complete len:90 (-) Transcript_13716:47-316(-)